MTLANLTDGQAVEQAIREFDQLGRDAFLAKYGFGGARGWLLVRGDQEYDAKAIAGAAHGFQYPDDGPLMPEDFHGGQPTARRLRNLGFTVKEPDKRNPTWSRDELILAFDVYMRHRPIIPGDRHPDVLELSTLLRDLAEQTQSLSSATFRNANGVAMKLQNFRRLDPDQNGKGLRAGGSGEQEVWSLFEQAPQRLTASAAAIRAAVLAGDLEQVPFEFDGREAEEGRVLTRLHAFRERDPRIVKRRKEQALLRDGRLACEVCAFDFGLAYGARGEGYIECHHLRPVCELAPGDRTRMEDLALLCANCHRIIHAARPWLTLDELKALVSIRDERYSLSSRRREQGAV